MDWIKRALAQPGKSQRGLATALGIDPSGVSRLLAGSRELKASELKALVDYLGVKPPTQMLGPDGLSEPAAYGSPVLGGGELDTGAGKVLPAVATLDKDVEVRGVAVGGEDAGFAFNGEVIDYARRPPGLIGSRNVFAIYVVGESMAPRYDEGDMVFVHPGRPPRPGCDVIVELHGKDGEPGACYIKRLQRRTPTRLVLSQFNPAREIVLPLQKVR
ncbi:MAG TPA: S24 family peptidase, partial [Kiloniellaceae bacterium]|nr:S24 family peptidase [Kiloniellaceae bacterium]